MKPFGTYALKSWRAAFLSCAQSMPVNWFGRRGALFLRKAVLVSGPAVVDANVEGLKLRLHMTDNVSERKFLFLPQFFDRYERDLVRSTLQAGGVFVDVGANAGIYSMTAAACVGDSGCVVAIEPNPVVVARIAENAAMNGFEKRVRIVQAGVSDVAGTFDLVLDDSNLGGSSLVAARSDKKITVTCKPLLDIVQEQNLSHIDALKIDIEGAEDKALVPFFQTASAHLHPKLIVLENSVQDWSLDLLGVLEKAGYKKSATTRMNLVFQK